MKQVGIRTLVLLILINTWAGQMTPAKTAGSVWRDKVAPTVFTALQEGETEFLVILREQADLSAAQELEAKLDKGTYVFETLTGLAETSQRPLRRALDAMEVDYKPFWVANMVWVRGDYETLQALAQREEVAKVEANLPSPITIPRLAQDRTQTSPDRGVEWNIHKINAPRVWALGFTGQGIVIGGQDTGYDWDHPALKGKYRGWDGAVADHNYSWHDAIGGTNQAIDPHGHGTHTMGIMVGEDDGGDHQIGVAPGAEWIGCRNMDSSGYGTPASYTACYQWFIAPTDLNGENANPDKAPHVINNSWSCPVSEGCSSPDILLSVVQAVRAAGIVTVHSAGNDGSACTTVSEPATIYAESFSVGATNSDDSIVGFSSRGPVTVDGSNRLKPNISAPGASILSSFPGGTYGLSSGTSMASPHVAGLVALLLSANPNLIGHVDQIEDLIEASALPRTTSQDCGGVLGSAIPNNTYGYGRIDAWAALNATMEIFYYPVIYR
jgi:subtilisin family serine protease